MELKNGSKQYNTMSIIGSVIIILSAFCAFASVLEMPFYLTEHIRITIFVLGLISLGGIFAKKNKIVLISGVLCLIILINRVITDDSVKLTASDYVTFFTYTSHRYVAGFYLLLFGSILAIVGTIVEFKKNYKDTQMQPKENVFSKDIEKNEIQRRLFITITTVIFITGIVCSTMGKWEQNNLGLWRYKRAGIFNAKGLNQIGGKYYLFDNYGYMLTGKQVYNNNIYFFNADGSAQNGWVLDGSVYHFCKEDGSIVKDTWIDKSNNISNAYKGTFYIDEYGNLVAGQSRVLGGKNFDFDNKGYKIANFAVTNVYFNTSQNSKEKMSTINIHQAVHCHYTVECDEYDAEGQLYEIVYFPNGQISKGKPEKYHSGNWSFSYSNGIYPSNVEGPAGNLTIQFYDMKNRLIGQGSVLMTK